jgi:hypothetical protein
MLQNFSGPLPNILKRLSRYFLRQMSKQNRLNKTFDVCINLVYRYIAELLGVFEYFKLRLG